MAPSAVDVYPTTRLNELKIKAQEFVSQQTAPAKLTKTPIQLTGALDKFESFDVTPVIGKEFPKANLAQWLEAPNADELIRDLAVTGNYLHSLKFDHRQHRFSTLLLDLYRFCDLFFKC